MKRLVVTLAVMGFFMTPAMANTSTHVCAKKFTVEQAKHAVNATFRNTKDVTKSERRRLDRYTRCQRNPNARKFVRGYRQRAWHAWKLRRNPPLSYGYASQYDDSGTHCCGFYATYGVAVCGSAGPCYPQGTKIEFYYGGRHVIAIVDDHGPYAGGRNFDLANRTAAALGFNGLGTVGYRVL